MTPVEVLAAHRWTRRWDDGYAIEACTGCRWTHPGRHPEEAGALHAAHVLDALTKAGHETAPIGTSARASRADYYLREYEKRGDEMVRLRVEIRELRAAAAEAGGNA